LRPKFLKSKKIIDARNEKITSLSFHEKNENFNSISVNKRKKQRKTKTKQKIV